MNIDFSNMTLTNVANRIKQLRPDRWLRNRQNNRQHFDDPLLARIEILDLRYRVEAMIGDSEYRHDIEHRTLGDVRSVYRGYGMDYDESRPYLPGDELRFMNWRATARTGKPHMKVFREERKPTVFIVVDRRQNMCFGTRRRLKVTQAVRAAATIAFYARLTNAPVAGVLLESELENALEMGLESNQASGLTWVKETGNEAGVFNFIHAANKSCPPPAADPQGRLSDELTEQSLPYVIKLLTPMLAQGSSVVLISDFHDVENNSRSSLLELSMTHHLEAIHIIDPVEKKIPACGSLLLQSNEQSLTVINSSDDKTNSEYQNAAASYLESRQEFFRSLGIPCHTLMTDDDNIESIIKA
jgi:uncharacterized protein (DUF58 family)